MKPENFKQLTRAVLGLLISLVWASAVWFIIHNVMKSPTTELVSMALAIMALVTVPMGSVINWFFSSSNETD